MDKNLMNGFEKYFFSINKPYKYIICSFVLLFLFSGFLAGLPYRPLINAETYPYYYRLLAFYNGIANATVGFIALILGPIAGLIAGFFETILTLIFKIGFFRGRVYVGLDNFELFADESVYFFFMYALFGLVTGLCFHIMKLKTNISFKKIVVINSIIIFFNLIINHLIFSTIYYENNINQRLNGVMSWGVSGAGGIFRKYFSNLFDREWYYIGTILTKPPVHIIIIECASMVVIGTLFILYYRKVMERRIIMSDNFNEKVTK